MDLRYKPFEASYNVKITSECPFFDEDISTLTYEIHVRHLKTENSFHYVEVTKSNVVMNEEEVQDAFNDVLLLTAGAIEKVIIKMDVSGKALAIANFDEVRKKWFEIRKMVESSYQGETISEYLDTMEEKLSSPEILWKALNRSYFNTVFFNGIYKDYGFEKVLEEEMLIPDLLPTQLVGSVITKKISIEENGEEYKISLNGTEAFDEFTPKTRDFFKEEAGIDILPETSMVKVNATYCVSKTNHAILSAQMESECILGGVYSKKLSIELSTIY
ncbi:MAG: hypothetical protein H7329_02870 [Opitutaceae bacterium]|nr:hypothetical protein [Cytophagales bacterium]